MKYEYMKVKLAKVHPFIVLNIHSGIFLGHFNHSKVIKVKITF